MLAVHRFTLQPDPHVHKQDEKKQVTTPVFSQHHGHDGPMAKKEKMEDVEKSLSKRLARWNVWRHGSGNGEMDKIKRHIWQFVDDAHPVRRGRV